jgi:Protein kinase domain/Gram-negative bacterial TonB protein C-terminal
MGDDATFLALPCAVQPVDDRGRMVEKLLGGRYEVLGFLGRGGFASVYQVRSASLQRFEALKVLHESHGEDSDFVQRFRQEARVAASLEHPSIVKVYDFGHVEGTLWYSMQFVEGPSLKGEIATRGTFDEEAAARIMVPLLDALDYSHARGVVHRDIKPDNVLLDKRGRPFLMDFGIAKIGASLVKTQTGFILGSPAYLSPEQLRGQPLDGRTDVYSLGVTLYQMLAGIIPYRTENMSALARRLNEEAPRLSGRREGIHPELERIVHRSLERNRDARYANAAEMRDDLEAFLAEVHPRTTRVRAVSSESPTVTLPMVPTVASVPAPPLARPAPEARREPPAQRAPAPTALASARRPAWLWPAAAILVLAALAALAAGIYFLTRAPAPSPGPAPVATPAPMPAPAPVPAPVLAGAATAAPFTVPTAPAPMAVPIPVPAAKPTALPAPTRLPRLPREAPARAPALAKTAPPPDVPRRAMTKPDVEEEARIALSPAQERECGGQVVGISVVIGEDGSLKSRHVISSVSPACDALALEAVTRNRYKAALDQRGRPVEGRFLLSIRF